MSRILFVTLAAALSLGVGCGRGDFSARKSNAGSDVFRYPIPELTKLDPAMVQDGDTIDVLQQVYEGLTAWGEDSKVRPNLAERWEISEDGRTYTFFLKKGIRFHNGREITAEDFKYSIERVADPALQSPTVLTYLADIVGVRDKLNRKATEVSGVKVVDPQTLQITIDKPRPYFLGRLTYPASFAVCREAVGEGEITKVSQMVGSGPFIAEKFQPDGYITLKANEQYHGGAPQIAGIERPIIKDATTRLNKFRAGELDLTRVERRDVAGLQRDDKLKDQIVFYDRPSIYYVGLNVGTYAPFKDLRVRRAFAMAIDKERICREVLGGINKPAHSVVPPGVTGFRESAKDISFDATAAKRLLAEAGFPNGQGMPPLVLSHRDGQPDVEQVADAIVTQLRSNLGIQVKTNKIAWAAYLDRHTKRELDFFHMRWAADYLDPENFLSALLATYGAENKLNYSNPAYDALTSKADTLIGDEAERMRLYAQAEDIVLQDAVFIPIYFQRDAELISPRVRDLRESLFGHLPHTRVSLE